MENEKNLGLTTEPVTHVSMQELKQQALDSKSGLIIGQDSPIQPEGEIFSLHLRKGGEIIICAGGTITFRDIPKE